MAEFVGLVASIFTIIETTSRISEYCGNVRNATADMERLRKEIESLKATLEQVQSLCQGPNGAKLQSSKNLLDGIKDCESLLTRLDARILNPRSRDKITSRLKMHPVVWPFKTREVDEIMNKLRNCKDNMSFVLQVDQVGQALKTHQNLVLNTLPSAPNAAFNSHAEEHHARCHSDTRVQLLQQINTWVDEPGSECIFWLNGMAGTGKSTISRTVAENFAQKGELGASFFFKRGEGDRGHAGLFCATVATQLVQNIPCLAPHVQNAIEADSAISTKALRLQFESLVSQPLEKIGIDPQKPSRIIIVIDALDECDGAEDIRIIIHLLSQAKHVTSVCVKFFLTSRPELPIRLGFDNISGSYEGLTLHQIPENIVREDITAFLTHELAMIRDDFNHSVTLNRQLPKDWPGQANIRRLVEMAIPLFIFAKTVCLFINDRKIDPPKDQLAKILQYETKSQASKLDATYLPVLNQMLVGVTALERRGIIEEFHRVVGSIAILASPLSATSLDALLGIPEGTVDNKTDFLHSVLEIPSNPDHPIRLLHLSFRDFLVSPETRDTNPFWINEKDVHKMLANRCLQHLSTGNHLKKDICNLRMPEIPREEIGEQIINAYLPSDIRYACQYWVFHLREGGGTICDDDQVYVFLERHFLHWLEALSLIRRLSESISMIDDLLAMLNPVASTKGYNFLSDAKRFILRYRSIAALSPLQLYSSALIFAPMESVIRNTFQNYIPDWISQKPHVEMNYGSALQTLDGHRDLVRSVVFSKDSKLLASGSRDGIVNIWDVDIGSLRQTLNVHKVIHSLSFSHDSKLLGIGLDDGAVNIWDVGTGLLQYMLKGYDRQFQIVAFSLDSNLLALADVFTVMIWDTSIDILQPTLQITNDKGTVSLAFSHDSKLLALAGYKEINIWNIGSYSLQQTLQCDQDSLIQSVALSSDSKQLATATYNKLIIWDINTGCIQKRLQCIHDIYSVALSHDSKWAASGSYGSVKIWDLSIDSSFQRSFDPLTLNVEISRDSKLLASGNDKRLMIWDMSTGSHLQTLDGHNDLFRFEFSPDSNLLASVDNADDTGDTDDTDYAIIRTWNISKNVLQCTFKIAYGHFCDICFSEDSKLIAVASGNTIRIWDAVIGSLEYTLSDESEPIHSSAFSPDSKLLASFSSSKIKVWNISTCLVQQTFDHDDNSVMTGFSNDSKLLALIDDDHLVKVWNIKTGFVQQFVARRNQNTTSLSFDNTDSNLVSKFSFLKSLEEYGKQSCGVNVDTSWITWNSRNLLWLPPDYRQDVKIGLTRIATCRGAEKVYVTGLSSAILNNLLGS